MKKKSIFTILLLMLVGFATVATNLLINGSTTIKHDSTEGDVYFSAATANTGGTAIISTDKKTITFKTSYLSSIGDISTLNFTVRNSSTQYDATVSITCTGANDYYTLTPDASNYNVDALSEAKGKITVALTAVSTENITDEFTCTLTSTAEERNTIAVCEWEYVDSDADGAVSVGDEYKYCGEAFNVISNDDTTITMLAAYGLGHDYRQTNSIVANDTSVVFSDTTGWEYTPGPKEIDVQTWVPNIATYINEYVSYLQTETGDTSITGDLITLAQLKTLGCTFNEDYSYEYGATCTSSSHIKWLRNGNWWWTRSANPAYSNSIWFVNTGGSLSVGFSNYGYSVRPVITISKSTVENL